MILSLSGVDGSGKTTIAKKTRKMLIQTGVEAVYRHEYNYFILRYFFKIVGTKRVEGRRKLFLSTNARKTALDKLWPYLVLIDASLLILWLKLTKRKAVVILDRFLYDQLVSFKGLGVASKLVEWLYMMAPSPDVAVVLSASPKVAYERKRDTHRYSLQFYRRGNSCYLKIARQLWLATVNADLPLSVVFTRVLETFLSNENFKRLLISKGANNRVIYKVVSEYDLRSPHFNVVRKTFKRKVTLLQRTLDFVEEFTNEAGVEWLLFKSYMPFPHVPTYDVDILIRPSDRSRLLAHLESRGIPYCEEELDKINIRLPNLYPVSIHFGATWEGINYVSTKTLWRDIRNLVWHGYSVKVPGYSAELLTHAAHIFFELSFIRLSDAVYLSELMKRDIDWRSLLYETERYNWRTAFVLVIHLIRRITCNSEVKVKLPHPISYGQVVKIFLEIIANDIKRKSFFLEKAKEYAREMVRYAVWRVGARMLGRAPFGEILDDEGVQPHVQTT